MNIELNRLTFEAIESVRKQLVEAETGLERSEIMVRLVSLYASIDFNEMADLLADLLADMKNVEPIMKKKVA